MNLNKNLKNNIEFRIKRDITLLGMIPSNNSEILTVKNYNLH